MHPTATPQQPPGVGQHTWEGHPLRTWQSRTTLTSLTSQRSSGSLAIPQVNIQVSSAAVESKNDDAKVKSHPATPIKLEEGQSDSKTASGDEDEIS